MFRHISVTKTLRRLEKTKRNGVFLSNFEVSGYVMKHYLSCTGYLRYRNFMRNEGNGIKCLWSFATYIQSSRKRTPAGRE